MKKPLKFFGEVIKLKHLRIRLPIEKTKKWIDYPIEIGVWFDWRWYIKPRVYGALMFPNFTIRNGKEVKCWKASEILFEKSSTVHNDLIINVLVVFYILLKNYYPIKGEKSVGNPRWCIFQCWKNYDELLQKKPIGNGWYTYELK